MTTQNDMTPLECLIAVIQSIPMNEAGRTETEKVIADARQEQAELVAVLHEVDAIASTFVGLASVYEMREIMKPVLDKY